MMRTNQVPTRAHSPSADPTLHRHLNRIELARRWRISERTLERWRWRKQGPRYIKIGGRVVYRLADIEAFEAKQAHEPSGINGEKGP